MSVKDHSPHYTFPDRERERRKKERRKDKIVDECLSLSLILSSLLLLTICCCTLSVVRPLHHSWLFSPKHWSDIRSQQNGSSKHLLSRQEVRPPTCTCKTVQRPLKNITKDFVDHNFYQPLKFFMALKFFKSIFTLDFTSLKGIPTAEKRGQ